MEVYVRNDSVIIEDTISGTYKYFRGTKYELDLLFTVVDIEFKDNNEFIFKYFDFGSDMVDKREYYKRIE
ncbi:hypothetical protein SAMN05443667_1222 [Flavobacterium gillisiae]|jgi:hypothetical protein|uniref:Uncharacterized protein n=1 Tax=Flavobacterium gillisiae TaxID=150146 RepID=A0A1H4GCG4_9FLAO|nr:hypothetical protein [Flavobacterium gillisiae]SEB07313.1 hypothetical protein SAMN05443667_1222 [Flavobacterium gillisiae]